MTWRSVVMIEIELFLFGFVYGLVRGNMKTHWLGRSLFSGAFFALLYIAIPALYIQGWVDRRQRIAKREE